MTFNVSHFRNQKIHEIPVEFKTSFDSPWKGVVLIRIQYVHNEEQLFTEILTSCQNKEALIQDAIKILERQKDRLVDRSSKDKNFVFDGPSREDSRVLGAAFYSNASGISEHDKTPLIDDRRQMLSQQYSMRVTAQNHKVLVEISIDTLCIK